MKYVKYFNILGIDTAQIPCIELHGVPNAATVGAVGLLGIDVDSEGHELYKCVKVEGSIYTWEQVTRGRDGTGIIGAYIDMNGELQLTLSNGNTLDAGVVKGDKGEKGDTGPQGLPGGYAGVWVSGTTRTTVLPESGLYEFKVATPEVPSVTAIVNWDRTSASSSLFHWQDRDYQELILGYFHIDIQGLVYLYRLDDVGSVTLPVTDFYYRKLGAGVDVETITTTLNTEV